MRDYPAISNVLRIASMNSVRREVDADARINANSLAYQQGGVGHTSIDNNNPTCSQPLVSQTLNSPVALPSQFAVSLITTTTATTTTTSSVVGGSMKKNCRYHMASAVEASGNRFGNDRNQQTATIELNYHQNGTNGTDCGAKISPTRSSLSRRQQQQWAKKMNNTTSSEQLPATDVINSISGNIPATGFNSPARKSVEPRTAALNNCRNNISNNNNLDSDMNISIDNSLTDLNNLNLPPPSTIATFDNINHNQHYQQKQQQQQQQLHKHRYHGNFSTTAAACSSEKKNGYFLWILTPVAASISVAIVIAALAGPQWLYTEEKLPNDNYNGTANFNAQDDGAFITKYTKSSLWILCTTIQGVETYNCIKIDYFPMEGYHPDPHDSTQAIPYTVTKSCPFFLASGILLLMSFIVFLVPTCSHQNNLFYFSSGIMFIVSGLLMLIGLITYISVLKAEIGSKLRPRSTLQPALFKVIYGHSFFLFVFGFIATEFVGVLDIFLYISLQEVGYYSKLPCLLSFSNIQEKIKEGERTKVRSTLKQQQQQQQQQHQTSLHHHHHSHRRRHYYNTASELDLDNSKNLLHKIPGYTCKKHPLVAGAATSNLFLTNDLGKRYYFEKPRQQKCDLHSRNLAKSLNELYTEPAPPPPPPAAKAPSSQQHLLPFDMPKEFPLTRSVSTSTDLHTASPDGNNSLASDLNVQITATGTTTGTMTTAPTMQQSNSIAAAAAANSQKSCKNEGTITATTRTTTKLVSDDVVVVPTRNEANGEADLSRRPGVIFHNICGLSRGIRKTKDELFNEFCKRAGVRPRPKDIYYIGEDNNCIRGDNYSNDLGVTADDGGDRMESNENIYIIDNTRKNSKIQCHQLFSPTSYNQRRNSMFVEPLQSQTLRKINSNLSLRGGQSEKVYRKSLFDLDRYDSQNRNNYPDQQYYTKGDAGGLSARHKYDYNQMYQSQTLPRSFMKRNLELQESLLGLDYHPSKEHLHYDHQVFRPDGRYLSSDVPKSSENLNSLQNNSRTHDGEYSSERTNYQTTTTNLMPTTTGTATIQWPTAIATSPSNFSANSFMFAATGAQGGYNNGAMPSARAVGHSSPLVRLVSNALPQNADVTASRQHKISRGYTGINDRHQNIPTATTIEFCDAFDLDEIERERRRSHASLFEDGHYDLINGTAV